jgi:hypothetical protein
LLLAHGAYKLLKELERLLELLLSLTTRLLLLELLLCLIGPCCCSAAPAKHTKASMAFRNDDRTPLKVFGGRVAQKTDFSHFFRTKDKKWRRSDWLWITMGSLFATRTHGDVGRG